MTPRRRTTALLSGLLLAVSACSDDEPLTAPPVAASASASPTPSDSPSPSASPTPSPTPLSPFEDDPAVQAVRAYSVASVEAINTQNLQLPAFVGLATAERQGMHVELYTEDLGTHFPGPSPLAVVGVRVVSPTTREVLVCDLIDGWALDRPGGTPTQPRQVVAAVYEMVQEGDVWKVNDAFFDEGRSCDGVALPEEPA